MRFIILSIICAIPTLPLFFKDKADFYDSVKYLLLPDVFSWFKGDDEIINNMWAEFKIFIWIGVSCFLGYVVDTFIS